MTMSYLIHMQREGKAVNRESIACHGVNFVPDLSN